MSQRVVGLDLGAGAVKAAQLVRRPDGTFLVEHQASRTLRPGALEDGRVAPNARDFVVSRIRELFADEPFTTKDVVIGLHSSGSVFMDELLLPPMREEDYDAAIPNLIEARASGWSKADSEMSYTVVGPVSTEKGERTKVLVFRVLADYAREAAEIVEEAGLSVVGADLTVLATLRACAIAARPPRCLDVIVDIGANLTSVLVHHNGIPVGMALDPDLAGAEATRRIMEALGWDDDQFDQANWEKIGNSDEGSIVAQVRDDYSRFLASRIAGILETVTPRGAEPYALTSITLVGGGALLTGLGYHLDQALSEVPLSFPSLDPHIQVHPPAAKAGQPQVQVGGDHLAAIGLAAGKVS